jgi:hypothetical protein
VLSLSISSSVIPSANGSSFMSSVKSRKGKTAIDFSVCAALTDDAREEPATLARHKKASATKTSRHSVAPANMKVARRLVPPLPGFETVRLESPVSLSPAALAAN